MRCQRDTVEGDNFSIRAVARTPWNALMTYCAGFIGATIAQFATVDNTAESLDL